MPNRDGKRGLLRLDNIQPSTRSAAKKAALLLDLSLAIQVSASRENSNR
jgi:hypothetical protein